MAARPALRHRGDPMVAAAVRGRRGSHLAGSRRSWRGAPVAVGLRRGCARDDGGQYDEGTGVSRRGWLLFLAMSVIWGIPYLLIRVAVRDFPPDVLVFARTAPPALLLTAYAASGGMLRPLLPYWHLILLYSVVELVGPWLLLSHAEVRLSSSLAALLIATTPLVAAVLARVLGSERFDRRRLLGLTIGVAGVVALAGVDVHADDLL